ncbi:hypothetical protein Tco_1442305 [Tanacetum coccineum]
MVVHPAESPTVCKAPIAVSINEPQTTMLINNAATDKHKWKNPDSTNARRNRLRVTEEDPEHFGPDALPRPDGMYRIQKSQRSSNSTASSGSNPGMFQEMLQQQYELERKMKQDVLERESRERVDLLESQKIAEDMRVLTMDTSSLDPMNAAIVKAQQARIRAKYPTQE